MGDVSNGAGAAIYARFSSENQREASIDDQIRVWTAASTAASSQQTDARCPKPAPFIRGSSPPLTTYVREARCIELCLMAPLARCARIADQLRASGVPA